MPAVVDGMLPRALVKPNLCRKVLPLSASLLALMLPTLSIDSSQGFLIPFLKHKRRTGDPNPAGPPVSQVPSDVNTDASDAHNSFRNIRSTPDTRSTRSIRKAHTPGPDTPPPNVAADARRDRRQNPAA